MKKGCLALLVLFAVAWAGYRQLIAHSEIESMWGIPPLLALGLVLVVTNLLGIALALKQRRAASRPPAEWRDGDLIGVSGAISASRPLAAPFSGVQAAMVEYEIYTEIRDNDSIRKRRFAQGFISTPATVLSMRGTVRISGFPLLAKIKPETFTDTDSYKRCADFLLATTFKPESSNPLKLIGELNKVMSSDSAEISEHFAAGGVIADLKAPTDPSVPITADEIVTRLQQGGYILQETKIPVGATVTAFGSYRAAIQGVDIGSGMEHLSHTIELGEMESAVKKTLFKSVLAAVFWSGVFAAGNWFLARRLGLIQ